jgi:Formyl transferase
MQILSRLMSQVTDRTLRTAGPNRPKGARRRQIPRAKRLGNCKTARQYLGNMRKYRGQPPALWELYNNENEKGITVQILSSGLDCGVPIEERTVEIRKTDTLKKLQDRSMSESINMMYEALKKLNDPGFVPSKIDSFGKVYTIPNLRQWSLLNLKALWRRISG